MYTVKERAVCIIADIVKSMRELEKLTKLLSLSELDNLEKDPDMMKYIAEYIEIEKNINNILAEKEI